MNGIGALGRCKDVSAFEAVHTIALSETQPSHIRRMALQSAWHLLPEAEQQPWLEGYYQQLPESLRSIVEGSAKKQAKALLKWAKKYKSGTPKEKNQAEHCFVCLYLKAKSDAQLRLALLKLCRIAPLKFGSVWLIRLFFKVAEFELDAELLAILTLRIENSTARYNWKYQHQTWQRSGRDYFRRRSWRILRCLGELNDSRFVPLATALLQQYDDKEGDTRTIEKYQSSNLPPTSFFQSYCV